jgi:flagellar motor protein MotB
MRFRDHALTFHEFALAMHLASLAKVGFPMPESLPEYLIPGPQQQEQEQDQQQQKQEQEQQQQNQEQEQEHQESAPEQVAQPTPALYTCVFCS